MSHLGSWLKHRDRFSFLITSELQIPQGRSTLPTGDKKVLCHPNSLFIKETEEILLQPPPSHPYPCKDILNLMRCFWAFWSCLQEQNWQVWRVLLGRKQGKILLLQHTRIQLPASQEELHLPSKSSVASPPWCLTSHCLGRLACSLWLWAIHRWSENAC